MNICTAGYFEWTVRIRRYRAVVWRLLQSGCSCSRRRISPNAAEVGCGMGLHGGGDNTTQHSRGSAYTLQEASTTPSAPVDTACGHGDWCGCGVVFTWRLGGGSGAAWRGIGYSWTAAATTRRNMGLGEHTRCWRPLMGYLYLLEPDSAMEIGAVAV